MKRLNYRLSAFTVIEVMVALILTALAISLIFTGIRLAKRQSDTLMGQFTDSGEIDRLYAALQADASRASEIRRLPQGLDFRRADTIVLYLFADSLCVRKIGHSTDTFCVQIDSMACWFLNKPRENQLGVVDECTLQVSINNRSAPLLVRKTYDMATLMGLTDSTDNHE